MKKLIDCIKIGDRVFDILEGWGTVVSLTDDAFENTPILVKFDNDVDFKKSTNSSLSYTIEGKEHPTDINSSLFLEEIKLVQKLPEFVEGEIVIVSQNNDIGWQVAEYLNYNSQIKTHRVKLIWTDNSRSVIDYAFLNCKSFDKSHFQQ